MARIQSEPGTDEQLAKLPKWAAHEIRSLRYENGEKQRRLEGRLADWKDPLILLDPFENPVTPIGGMGTTVRFVLDPDDKYFGYIDVSLDYQSGGKMLRVSGDGTLWVMPVANNSALLVVSERGKKTP